MRENDEYSRVAGIYDLALDPALGRVRRAAARHVYGRFLDLCCGTGRQLQTPAEAASSQMGLDRSRPMLAQAAAKTPAGTPLVRGDALRLPFRGDSFDSALVSFGLHEKEGEAAGRMLEEMIRVVRPGGRLIFADFTRPTERRGRLSYVFIQLVEIMGGRRHFSCFRSFMRQGGLVGFLAARGVTAARADSFFGGAAGLYLADNPSNVVKNPAEANLSGPGPEKA